MTKAVILATDDTEFGHAPADKAKAEAQALANEQGKPVTLRDPVTDEVLGTIEPTAPGKAPGGCLGGPHSAPARPATRQVNRCWLAWG